jgi:3-hydroxyacyl-[acyl-carrier-protein] dehydratase
VKAPIVDFSEFDVNKSIVTLEEIQQINPHRHELSLLDGIVFENLAEGRCVGYRDVREDDFWVRGHFPGFPLMPGVLICESAAQLCSYFASKTKLLGASIIALGGLDEVRFRGPVKPNSRLVTMLLKERVRPNVMISGRFQCYVDQELVCDGIIKGVAINQQ